MPEKVQVYQYDMSRGVVKGMSRGLLGKQIDGIWHTGIVVYGGEYFFGSDGINMHAPPGTIPMLGPPLRVLEMGETQIPKEMFHEYLNQVGSSTFRGDRYNLIDHNCNNFSNEASQFLTGKGIPSHILSLPHDILSTPMGQMFKPMLDQMMLQVGPDAGDSMPHFGSTTPTTATTSSKTSSDNKRPPSKKSTASKAPGASQPKPNSSTNKKDKDKETGKNHHDLDLD